MVLGHCYGVLPAALKTQLHWLKDFPLLLFTNGRAAVMVFFVLSGFVLALPWCTGRAPSYGAFVLRRICRIYIPFAATVILAAVLLATAPQVAAGTADWAERTWGGVKLAPDMLAGHFLMTGIWPHIVLDTPIWSLVHEMRASLVFPLLILLCAKTMRGVACAILLAAASTAAVKMYGGFRDFPIITDDFLATVLATLYVLPAFMLGILMAQHRAAMVEGLQKLPAVGRAALWVTTLGVFCLVHSFDNGVLMMIASGMLIALVLSSEKAGRVLALAPLRWMGRVSYSLYLVHVPVLFALVLHLRGHMGYGTIILMAIPAILITAELMCRFVEMPSMKLGKKLTN